jgi:hypothetical protein
MKRESKCLKKLERTLDQLKKAANSLNGEIARLHFDPNNPSEVNRVVQELERQFDAKVSPHSSNAAVWEIVTGLKQEFRKGLLKKAEETLRKTPTAEKPGQ